MATSPSDSDWPSVACGNCGMQSIMYVVHDFFGHHAGIKRLANKIVGAATTDYLLNIFVGGKHDDRNI